MLSDWSSLFPSSSSAVINMQRLSVQQCVLVITWALLLSATFSGAARGRLLLASESPVTSDIINSILSKGVKIFTFGQNTEIPPPILQGAADVGSFFTTPFTPSSGYNTKASTILFQCRAVGNQIYTASELRITVQYLLEQSLHGIKAHFLSERSLKPERPCFRQ